MFPSITCPCAGCSHRLVFFFLFHRQTEVEKGLFTGAWRTERAVDTAQMEEISVEVRSSADVALRSMDR